MIKPLGLTTLYTLTVHLKYMPVYKELYILVVHFLQETAVLIVHAVFPQEKGKRAWHV